MRVGFLVDIDNRSGLEDALNNEILDGAKRIVLDLKGMTLLHPAFLISLLRVRVLVRWNNGEMVLTNAPGFVRLMFDNWELTDLFIWINRMEDAEHAENMGSALDKVQKNMKSLNRSLEGLEKFIG